MSTPPTSDEVLAQLREAARQRRRKLPPEPKKRRSPSQTLAILKALQARAALDPGFAANLARSITAYQPMVEAWIRGGKRPSPKRRRQIMRYLSHNRGNVSLD